MIFKGEINVQRLHINDVLKCDTTQICIDFGRMLNTGSGVTSHPDLEDKNAETGYQHVDTTTTKETLVNDDKVTILDSETGKVVLTDKRNVGFRITDAISTTEVWSSSKTNEEISKLLPLIYAGL